jgi:acetolactate synthase I/II/III large subunit
VSDDRVKYADLVAEWLEELGYTHCFFVAGGNIMHLLDGMRKRMTCVPFVHEVAAGIAAEYFNESAGEGRAFALVTAGPGLTNVVTAISSAWLESHELLVLGGQVKTSDLARREVRQRGIQEVDGRDIVAPTTKAAVTFEEPPTRARIAELVELARTPRKGPVFLEFPLDVQGAPVDRAALERDAAPGPPPLPRATDEQVASVRALLERAERPVLLIGGGVSRATARALRPALEQAGIPVLTTWNGMDRFDSADPFYFGRPNTWGQRSANIIMQSADVLVAAGTRLGLQQTGFNWQEFVPGGTVVQIDVDEAELRKGHPEVDVPVHADADDLLPRLLDGLADRPALEEWRAFARRVRELLPLNDPGNEHGDGYVDPWDLVLRLSSMATPDDVVVPCSSGGPNVLCMQAWQQKLGQPIVTNKGSASMGLGLSGAIGAALAHPGRRTVHVEGDGGFAQNLQELAIVDVNRLPIKMFIIANEGYASIRMTQRNYFGGEYLGCDTRTGLGFPDWVPLFTAFRIPAIELGPGWEDDERFRELWESGGPAGFIVPVDPEQTYFPKISSRVTATGSMESNPLHRMSPDLPDDVAAEVLRFLPA